MRWTLGLAIGLTGCPGWRETEPSAPHAEHGNAEPTPKAARDRPARRDGRFRKAPADPTLEALEAIGYVQGSQEASEARGVTLHDVDRAVPGFNLYTSGHETAAFLMDMNGEVQHRWRASWSLLFPQDRRVRRENARFWRRATLLDDGSVLGIFEGLGIVRVGLDGHVLWALDNGAHHDLDVVNDQVWLLARTTTVVPEVHPTETILEDAIVRLDLATGEETARISLIKALHDSGHPTLQLVQDEEAHKGDVLHTNSIDWLDAEEAAAIPGAEAGHLLVSFLAIDELAVIDPESGLATWTATGPFHRQHDPHVLGSDLLLFDNHAAPERSRVRALDPATLTERWGWSGPDGIPLFSDSCGAVTPLPGGNLLVTESDAGRAWEITAEGEVVWSFVSPHRAGKRSALVATLFEVVRLPTLPAPLQAVIEAHAASGLKDHRNR